MPEAVDKPPLPTPVAPIVFGAAGPSVLRAAEDLAGELARQQRQFARLRQVIEHINRGLRLEEILSFLFEELRDVIPYNRIAFAAIERDTGNVVARWARSDEPLRLVVGYAQPLAESGLAELARTGRPRIINDLVAYLRDHPQSAGTRQLVEEHLRSSLSCPLLVENRPVGFLFFDSNQPAAYGDAHIEFFRQVAGVVAAVIERGQMYDALVEQKETIAHQNVLLADENRRNQQELELARKVQRALMPSVLHATATLQPAMFYEPAEQIGGDLLDCIRLDDDTLLVYVADAMGHGVAAALLMSAVRTAFYGALAKQPGGRPSPAALLRDVNRTIVDLFGTNFVTAVCGRLDAAAQQMTFAVAGHPQPLVCRADRGAVEHVDGGSLPLGIEAGTAYADTTVPWRTGDMLLLYTDGVIDAAGPDGTRFGLPALEELLHAAPGESAEQLIDRLREAIGRHCQGRKLEDDVAVLAVHMTATSPRK